jgi:glycosyltransferase involved in cell wall biosynthesis
MVPYKRMDLIAAAFARMPERRLIIAGDGPERARVEAAAGGAANIEFRGAVSDAEMVALMRAARAFVFAAEEDFGIMMVEAQACGTPVIAFGRGGSRDILGEETGIFFGAQTPEAIAEAVDRFEAASIRPEACRANALRFSRAAFRARITTLVERALADGTALRDG